MEKFLIEYLFSEELQNLHEENQVPQAFKLETRKRASIFPVDTQYQCLVLKAQNTSYIRPSNTVVANCI